jgi:hypothetical protein
MMRLGTRIWAGQHEQFAPEAAESMIGQTFNAKVEERVIGTGTIITAQIVENGHAIDLIIEWPEDLPKGV